MNTPKTITIENYCNALTTWIKVANRPAEESVQMNNALAKLRERFGNHAIKDPNEFCKFMRSYGPWSVDLYKSCLLDRLIYAQEPLRSRPCPTHKGRWSGCFDICPHGCNFGGNITGWLPEGVDEAALAADALHNKRRRRAREGHHDRPRRASQ